MVILNMGAGLDLVSEKFLMSAWAPLLQKENAICLRSASNISTEARGLISLNPQKGQLYAKVGFLVIPGLAANMPLDTVFISWYITNSSPKAETIRPVNSSSVRIAKAVKKSLAMAIKKSEHQNPVEAPCAMSRLVRLSPMCKTFVRVRTAAGGIHLVKTHDNLAGRHQSLVV